MTDRLHIALDARAVLRPQRRGIGKATLELYRCLLAQRPAWRVTAFYQPADWHGDPALRDAALSDLPPHFTPRAIDMPGDRFDAWTQVRLPLAAKLAGANLLHCPANVCPRFSRLPTVVTVHDLIPLQQTIGLPSDVRRLFARAVRFAAAHAQAIICPSQHTRSLLLSEVHACPSRLHVVPWGAPLSWTGRSAPTDDDRQVLARHRIDRPFVLHLGAADPRKNTVRLLDAWQSLRTKQQQQHQLLIVGLDGDAQKQMMQWVSPCETDNSIRLHGFVSESDLASLMRQAVCLAYPSLDEGFGLPLLEAMARDTRVLPSRCGSLPEVADAAAWYVDAHDTLSLAQGLGKLLSDEATRRALVARGRENLLRFNWQAAAASTAMIFEETQVLSPQREVA